MFNYTLFKPKNFLLIGLMGLTMAMLSEHIYNTVIDVKQEKSE